MKPRETPWLLGAAGAGALAVQAPLAATGVGATLGLSLLPWMTLFGVLALAVNVQSVGIDVAGMRVRPDMLLVVAFAVRAFTLPARRRLDGVAWALVAFLGLQVATSLLHAEDVASSLRSVGLLAVGVLAFAAVTTAIGTAERLVRATRWFLAATALGVTIGLAALVWHWVTGSLWGIVPLETLRGFPSITGLAFEHGIYGSMCLGLAIACLALWREDNPVCTRGPAWLGFWLGTAGTVLSLSRGAWVGWVVGVAAAWLIRPRGARSVAGLLVWGGLGLATVVLVAGALASGRVVEQGSSTAGAIGEQATQVLDLSASTGAQRVAEWRTSLAEVGSSPFLGLGTNSYGQRHIERTRTGPKPAYVGNWAVRTLYDSGLVGLLLLSGALAMCVWPGPRVRTAAAPIGPVARSLAVAGVAVLVAFLATDALLFPWPWVAFGLARSARLLAAEQGGGRTQAGTRGRGAPEAA